MCLGLGLLEKLTGASAARKAAQKQAKRAEEFARLGATSQQDQLETNIQQQVNAQKAADLLGVPIEGTDVTIGDGADGFETDPTTGRKRANRSRFQMPAASGLSIP